MKRTGIISGFFIFFLVAAAVSQQAVTVPKSRVIVLTDMLNEADDSQTMVRLLMYSNKLDIEGLIAVSSCHQYKGKNDPNPLRNTVHPEEIKKFIRAYAQVQSNLSIHEKGWPPAEYLMQKVGAGPEGYGMDALNNEKHSTGAEIIMQALLKNDKRPVYFCINAGANCLAQALILLRSTKNQRTFKKLLQKIRVYDDAGQDDAGAWIAKTFPLIQYYRSQSQVFSFLNNTGPIVWDNRFYPGKAQHLWAKEHIQENHGPLGALYPDRMRWKAPDEYHTLEGGGTTTWIGHVNNGLFTPEKMEWGGWGGRFKTTKENNVLAKQLVWAGLEHTEDDDLPFKMICEASDEWTDPETGIKYQGDGVPVFRWRRAYQNDFAARMDWCTQPYSKANHNPVAVINGDASDAVLMTKTKAGSNLTFTASASTDPDGDSVSYHWFIYKEAGNYPSVIALSDPLAREVNVKIPKDAGGKQIHLILEINDNHKIIPLYDYRRIVIDVK